MTVGTLAELPRRSNLREFAVLDRMMGSGKTEALLRHFEDLTVRDRSLGVIYATEYLTELDTRVDRDVWAIPKRSGSAHTKLEALKQILADKTVRRLAVTHKTLINAARDWEARRLIEARGFTLYLDETLPLVKPVTHGKTNHADFLWHWDEGNIEVNADDFGRAAWVNRSVDGYTGLSFSPLIHQQTIYACPRSFSGLPDEKLENSAVWLLELEHERVFCMFDRVVLSTYLFKDSLMDAYLKVKGIPWVPFDDVQCRFNPTKREVRDRIRWIDAYDRDFRRLSLSKTWHLETATPEQVALLNRRLRNVGLNEAKGDRTRFAYTVPEDALGTRRTGGIQPQGFGHTVALEDGSRDPRQSCYIPCNARASNDWRDKDVLVHAFNRFPDPAISGWVREHDLPFSADRFALSEVLQWTFRSAIRDRRPIGLAIWSERMRNLYKGWLDEKDMPLLRGPSPIQTLAANDQTLEEWIEKFG